MSNTEERVNKLAESFLDNVIRWKLLAFGLVILALLRLAEGAIRLLLHDVPLGAEIMIFILGNAGLVALCFYLAKRGTRKFRREYEAALAEEVVEQLRKGG